MKPLRSFYRKGARLRTWITERTKNMGTDGQLQDATTQRTDNFAVTDVRTSCSTKNTLLTIKVNFLDIHYAEVFQFEIPLM